jgi:hypothetical protein
MAHFTHTSTRSRAVRYAALGFAGLLLLGACSKKDDTTATSNQSNTGATSASGGSGSSGTAGTGDTKVKGTTPGTSVKNQSLDQTVWFEGYKVTLGAWNYDGDKEDFTVDIVVENLGDDTATYYGSNITLQDESVVVANGQSKEDPQIIAKGKANDVLTFSVPPAKWNPAKLSIIFGSGTQAQARVPLNGGTATTLKPVPQDSIKGALPVGNLTLTPAVAEVRWDNPNDHSQADKAKAFLAINGKVQNTSADATYYFQTKEASLKLPDGTTNTADTFNTKDGSSIAGTKSSEFRLWFTVADPFVGDYSLTFASPWGTDNADVTATVNFTLVKAVTATTSGTTPGSTPGTTTK